MKSNRNRVNNKNNNNICILTNTEPVYYVYMCVYTNEILVRRDDVLNL